MNPAMKKDIRGFLWVLFLGIAAGAICVLFLVLYYGPSGKYMAKNTLLAPHTLSKLWYSDVNSKTGGNSRFVFQKILLSYWEKGQKSVQLDEKQYASLYDAISSDKSLLEPSQEVIHFFDSDKLTRIMVMVKTEDNASWQYVSKEFQEVQFIPDGDYYRIELHEDASGNHWAYFYHPGIYKEVIHPLIHGMP